MSSREHSTAGTLICRLSQKKNILLGTYKKLSETYRSGVVHPGEGEDIIGTSKKRAHRGLDVGVRKTNAARSTSLITTPSGLRCLPPLSWTTFSSPEHRTVREGLYPGLFGGVARRGIPRSVVGLGRMRYDLPGFDEGLCSSVVPVIGFDVVIDSQMSHYRDSHHLT